MGFNFYICIFAYWWNSNIPQMARYHLKNAKLFEGKKVESKEREREYIIGAKLARVGLTKRI